MAILYSNDCLLESIVHKNKERQLNHVFSHESFHMMEEGSEHPKREEREEGAVVLDDEIKKPSLYKVFLHNDDYTTMEFVVFVLQKFFFKTMDEAQKIMLKIHREGSGLCGIYTFEVAESKKMKVLHAAKENGHPLQCSLEKN